MTFRDILNKYRTQSFSEQDKGTRFERLMKAWLLTAPQYQNVIKEVWMWSEFPFRKDFGSGHDVGIDLVARTVDGDYWAVQCKCYQDTQITKAHVDTFLSTSEKRFRDEELRQVGFTHRLWIATTEHWSSEATNALQNLSIPVSKISLYDLETSPDSIWLICSGVSPQRWDNSSTVTQRISRRFLIFAPTSLLAGMVVFLSLFYVGLFLWMQKIE